MRIPDGTATQRLSTDEAYERFFDGYYNLGRPDEIFGRDVVLCRPRVDAAKAPARRTTAVSRRRSA
jgi:hypothetical protein